jgi:hypothetical protein
VLGLVEHDDGDGVLLIEETEQFRLESPPELRLAVRRREAQLERERAVDVEGRGGRVAEVDDAEVGRRKLRANVPDGRRFSDAGLRGEDAEAWLFEELPAASRGSGWWVSPKR